MYNDDILRERGLEAKGSENAVVLTSRCYGVEAEEILNYLAGGKYTRRAAKIYTPRVD
jgi:hypothetical protein